MPARESLIQSHGTALMDMQAFAINELPMTLKRAQARAILSASQLRLPIEPQPPNGWRSMTRECDHTGGWWFSDMPRMAGTFPLSEFNKWQHVYPKCPYRPGSAFWVRETFDWVAGSVTSSTPTGVETRRLSHVAYRCDGGSPPSGKWTPASQMPFWASRTVREVKSLRAEKVQDITEADAIACGMRRVTPFALGMTTGWGGHSTDALSVFRRFWKSCYGRHSWDANPWVWVLTISEY